MLLQLTISLVKIEKGTVKTNLNVGIFSDHKELLVVFQLLVPDLSEVLRRNKDPHDKLTTTRRHSVSNSSSQTHFRHESL